MKYISTSKIKFFIPLFLLSFNCLLAQNHKKIKEFNKIDIFDNKDTITILASNKNDKPKPTILFLQGSLPMPLLIEKNNTTKVNLPFDYTNLLDSVNVVIIKRKGTLLSCKYDSISYIQSHPSKEFIKNDNLFYRANQAKITLNYLHQQKWVDKSKIFVVGHSEGYRVAAYVLKIAKNKISKVVCMSADPFNRSSEEITRLELNNITSYNDSITNLQISNVIENYKNLDNINNYKDDYSLFNWASYETNMPINYFKENKKPLLIVYGTNDEKSFNNHLIPILLPKKNIEIKAYPNMDHNFFTREYDTNNNLVKEDYHWNTVFNDVLLWLLK